MHHGKSSGHIIILALVFSAILLVLITGLVGFWLAQIGSHRQAVGRTQALSIAEAGLETAIWKLNNTPGYTGESNTNYGEGTFTVSMVNLNASTKLIRADAYIPNASAPRAKRSVQITATIGTTNIGFNYGVQVGNGGLEMTNSATVVGNVYSDGNIIGTNTARIQGTAIASGSSVIEGMDVDNNAQASRISHNSNVLGDVYAASFLNSTVGGDIVADSISNCSVGGDALYDTKSSCSVSGTSTTPNPNPYTPAPVVPMPVSEAQIDIWENEATSGGIMAGQSYSSGTRTLGPIKINGDLILSNTAEVVVTGTIWITGELKMSNSSIMRLSSSYGALSGVVVVGQDESSSAGFIELSNSAQALGSGTAGSYLMLLSQKEGFGGTAIKNNNSGVAAILYAGEGMVEITNSAAMKEITAGKLKITNSATVTYETGLANAAFSSGPGGGWQIQHGTWQLLQ
jgi:hypothetical protein